MASNEYTTRGNYWSTPVFQDQDIYPQLELNQKNIDQLNHQLFYPGMTERELPAFPSTRSSPVVQPSQLSSTEDIEETRKKASNTLTRQQLDEQDAILIAKDDSELSEEELALKRKAQNRQAQRAFRNRKETRLKDLQTKLDQSEQEKEQLLEQLACTRKQNLTIARENQLLKRGNTSTGNTFTFPGEQSFINGLISGTNHSVEDRDTRITYNSPEGKRLLGIGAVWDWILLQSEEYNIEYENLDINMVMSKLRGYEVCHGHGPAYPLDMVEKAFCETIRLQNLIL